MSGILDATKRLALRQDGGIRGLAARIGRSESSFYKTLSGVVEGHRLLADDVEAATAITQDAEVAKYLATLCNHVCLPLPASIESGDDELLKGIAEIATEIGRLAGETTGALQGDNRISRNEENRLLPLCDELMACVAEFRNRVQVRAAKDAASVPKLRAA